LVKGTQGKPAKPENWKGLPMCVEGEQECTWDSRIFASFDVSESFFWQAPYPGGEVYPPLAAPNATMGRGEGVYFPCALRRLCALHLELFALPSVPARFGSRFHLGCEDCNLVVFLQQITIAKLHDNQWSLFCAVK
jgi:hypothetical protein